jgi:serine protease inhibitor
MDSKELLEQLKTVSNRVKRLGVVDTFKRYSDFEEIDDNEFHKLRRYLVNHIDLMDYYLKKRINELENKVDEQEKRG